MENLPVPQAKDLLTYRNNETGKYEQIDLRTGKMYEPYLPVRKSEFSNDRADLILGEIRSGKSLTKVCEENNIQSAVFYAWLALYPEFKERYQEARKQRADYHYYRAVDLADNAIGMNKDAIPGIKLAVDTHKWAAEKSDPELFNKKVEQSNGGTAINITLNTGVLDTKAPPDIVIDEFGNFKGFENGTITVESKELFAGESEGTLTRERWSTPSREERGEGNSEGSSEEESKE